FLQVRQIARIHRLVHRNIAAVRLVDLDLHPRLERKLEEGGRRRERAVDGRRRNTVIDELERAPAAERRLEIARHGLVRARLAAKDGREADDGNLAHDVVLEDEATAEPQARSAPSPQRGEGWGEGVRRPMESPVTPSPQPTPQAGRGSPTEFAAL